MVPIAVVENVLVSTKMLSTEVAFWGIIRGVYTVCPNTQGEMPVATAISIPKKQFFSSCTVQF